jgi:hypothetical protein
MSHKSQHPPEFHVPWGLSFFGGLVSRNPRFWKWLGNVETSFLSDDLQQKPINTPIYICGLARSGSTILLEILASHADVATHRYIDFPPVYTPYFWNLLQRMMPRANPDPVERTHQDGMMVTADSPEAMEEILWMKFFPGAHDPSKLDILDEGTDRPDFETFYADHIRKILRIRNGTRYAAKGNYNIARIVYLQKLFPDARFVVPVRRPVAHIASMQKQQILFCKGESANPKMLKHLQRVGHFEFGLDRRPINVGNSDVVREIIELWKNGEEIRGWARYWAYVYGYLADLLETSQLTRSSIKVLKYEDLCEAAGDTISSLLSHCQLEDDGRLTREFAKRVHYPDYYEATFTPEEIATIDEETHRVAARFGY